MPKALEINGYQFRFYSNENDEPPHVHVTKGSGNAKLWLEPDVEEEYSYNFKVKERKFIRETTVEKKEALIKAWNEHFKKK